MKWYKPVSDYLNLSKGRWFVLFHVLLLSLLIFPLLEDLYGVAHLVFWSMHLLIVGTIIYTLSFPVKHRYVVLTLAALLVFLLLLPDSVSSHIIQTCILCVLYLYAIGKLGRFLIKARRIDSNELFGAISFYILIGILWSLFYILVNHFSAGSFTFPPSKTFSAMNWAELLYFSFITLTTTGFGDVLPVGGLARSLSMLEAITGILFIAVGLSIVLTTFISKRLK